MNATSLIQFSRATTKEQLAIASTLSSDELQRIVSVLEAELMDRAYRYLNDDAPFEMVPVRTFRAEVAMV